MMLKNLQRYFRFYLATVLFGLLLVGIHWQAAPLGAAEVAKTSEMAEQPVVKLAHPVAPDVAVR